MQIYTLIKRRGGTLKSYVTMGEQRRDIDPQTNESEQGKNSIYNLQLCKTMKSSGGSFERE